MKRLVACILRIHYSSLINRFLALICSTTTLLLYVYATPRQTVDFKDECLHKHKDVCIAAINAKLAEHPELFEDRDAFEFEVNKVREPTDEGYNIVSMRLNPDETTVGGLLGDGMIWYPYDWCLAADDCYTVGPWGKSISVDCCS
jgi:hypothetical protein